MKWNKITLEIREEVEDIVISTLADIGLEGAEIQDKQPLSEQDKKQMFVDILRDMPEDDGVAYLNFYLDEDEDVNAMLEKVKAELEELRMFVDIGSGMITLSQTEDKDWINNWKQYFKQFYVDDILIIPSWEEVKEEDKDRMIIHIDPGTAFGTGMHETTQLCIRQLKKYVTSETELLDVGTGSGILSIVALKLGAKHAVGTDLDPCAVPAVEENKEVNLEELDRVSCPVRANTIIVSRMNTPELVGACGYVEQDYPNLFLPDRLWQVHFVDSVVVKYVWYYLSSNYIRNYYSSLSSGTSSSMQNISQGQFENARLLLPPPEVQRDIVEFLDKKCATLDSLVAEKESLIADLEAYKKSLIFEVVTGKRRVV